MSKLKRTQLFAEHLKADATIVDFGGWEMPVQYPSGIVTEHLKTRRECGLFDVSHMGRLSIEGPQRLDFLQHVLSCDASKLAKGRARYAMIPDDDGTAIDDAYLYFYDDDRYLLVVNAANTEKDLAHFAKIAPKFDCRIVDVTPESASVALQGPKSRAMIEHLAGGADISGVTKNGLAELTMSGRHVRIAATGYTGEPIGYELFIASEHAEWLWSSLIDMGATPAGLGARDTLRLEAGFPLYGHDMGAAPDGSPMPIYASGVASFAVSFAESKGAFIGRDALARQSEAAKRIKAGDLSDISALPRRVRPIVMTGRGVMRAGMTITHDGRDVGWVTSGTMVPHFIFKDGAPTDETAKRSIGLCYVDSDIPDGTELKIDVRGKLVDAAITARHLRSDTPPYAVPVIHGA